MNFVLCYESLGRRGNARIGAESLDRLARRAADPAGWPYGTGNGA